MCGGKSLHKKDWLKIAGAVAAVSAPWTVPALGAALGGTAAAGAAGVGATGVAAGAGGTAGGMTALFGPEAATAGASGLLGSSATPMLTSLGTGAGVGGSSMFGAGQAASTLGSLGLTPEMSAGMNWGKGLETLAKANQYAKLAGGEEEKQQPQLMQRPQAQPVPQSDLEALYALIYPQKKRKDSNYV